MSSIFPNIESADGALDWVTIVTENELDGAMLRRISERWFALAERVKTWRMRGYNGRIGFDLHGYSGGLAYGENYQKRDVSYLAQSWGDVSNRLARQVVASHHVRITRLDYAVTVLFGRELPPIGEWPMDTETANSYTLTRVVPNNGTGGTLYVGARGSDVFGRVYDKGAELGTFPERVFWRWEVEYKREHAKQAYANWSEAADGIGAYEMIAHEITGWYREHGVPIPIITHTDFQKPIIRYATRVRMSETTIEWLHQQVNPALRKLGASGRLADALEALGVWDNQLVMSDAEIQRLAQWQQTDFLTQLERLAPEPVA